jgi:hypothetical protein
MLGVSWVRACEVTLPQESKGTKISLGPEAKKNPDTVAIEPPTNGTKAGCTISSSLSLSTIAASTLSAHPVIPSSPSSPHSLSGAVVAPMANFAIDPEPYIPPAMRLEDRGPHHHARTTVYIRGGDYKTHESYAIAIAKVNEELMTACHTPKFQILEYE